jgi:bacterioferritin-associated ferredoxin
MRWVRLRVAIPIVIQVELEQDERDAAALTFYKVRDIRHALDRVGVQEIADAVRDSGRVESITTCARCGADLVDSIGVHNECADCRRGVR